MTTNDIILEYNIKDIYNGDHQQQKSNVNNINTIDNVTKDITIKNNNSKSSSSLSSNGYFCNNNMITTALPSCNYTCGLNFNFDAIFHCFGNLDECLNSKVQSDNFTTCNSKTFIGHVISNRLDASSSSSSKDCNNPWKIKDLKMIARIDFFCTYDLGLLSYTINHTNDIDKFSNAFVQVFYTKDYYLNNNSSSSNNNNNVNNSTNYILHIYTKGQTINAIRNLITTEYNVNNANNKKDQWIHTLRNKLIYMRSIYGYGEAIKWLYNYRLITNDKIIDFTTLYFEKMNKIISND